MIYKIISCELGNNPKIVRIELVLSDKAFPVFVRRLESFQEMDKECFNSSINNINVDFTKEKKPYTKIIFYYENNLYYRKFIDDKDVA